MSISIYSVSTGYLLPCQRLCPAPGGALPPLTVFPLLSGLRRNPVIAPVAPMTRWHGAMIEIGFRPFAAPTARTAVGKPIFSAISPYVLVSPNGIFSNAAHTFFWNSVPLKSSFTSKVSRRPSKYSESCSAIWASTTLFLFSVMGPSFTRFGRSISHRMAESASPLVTMRNFPTGESTQMYS